MKKTNRIYDTIFPLKHRQRSLVITASLLLGDAICITLAYWFAYQLRFHILVYPAAIDPTYYLKLYLLILPLWLLIFGAYRLYNSRVLFGGVEEYTQVFNSIGLGAGVLLVIDFILVRQGGISRGWFLLFWLFALSLVGIFRFSMRRFIYFLRSRRHLLVQAVIVNADAEGVALYGNLKNWDRSGLRVVGFLDDHHPKGTSIANGVKVLGPIKDLENIVKSQEIEEVIVATGSLNREQITDIYRTIATQSQVKLRFSSGLFEMISTGLYIKEMANVPLIEVHRVRITGMNYAMKTFIDYTVAILGLLVLSPLYALIALLIRLDSPGPIFFKHRVLGLNGNPFDAIKFRTMHKNSNEILDSNPDLKAQFEVNYKLADDPRVTRVGRFLRRISLDELPQLFNILRGQMSLVGPRFISPAEVGKYGRWGLSLQTVKPGITGLWQVSGRSDVSYPERIKLDTYYIRNWTLWLDILILVRTIPAVLQSKGAY